MRMVALVVLILAVGGVILHAIDNVLVIVKIDVLVLVVDLVQHS